MLAVGVGTSGTPLTLSHYLVDQNQTALGTPSNPVCTSGVQPQSAVTVSNFPTPTAVMGISGVPTFQLAPGTQILATGLFGVVGISGIPTVQLPAGTVLATSGVQTVNTFKAYSKTQINPSGVLLSPYNIATALGVQVKAYSLNTGNIYIGQSSGVTANSTEATDGYELTPGEGVFLPVSNPNLLWVIGSASGQKAFYVVL